MIDNLYTKFYKIMFVGRALYKFNIGWNSPFGIKLHLLFFTLYDSFESGLGHCPVATLL